MWDKKARMCNYGIVENESNNDCGSKTKVCGMHAKNRMEFGYAIMTIETESKVRAMHNKGKMDFGINDCSE